MSQMTTETRAVSESVGQCSDPLSQVRTELSSLLPLLNTSPFIRSLACVFSFYALVTLLSVLLIVFSIWL